MAPLTFLYPPPPLPSSPSSRGKTKISLSSILKKESSESSPKSLLEKKVTINDIPIIHEIERVRKMTYSLEDFEEVYVKAFRKIATWIEAAYPRPRPSLDNPYLNEKAMHEYYEYFQEIDDILENYAIQDDPILFQELYDKLKPQILKIKIFFGEGKRADKEEALKIALQANISHNRVLSNRILIMASLSSYINLPYFKLLTPPILKKEEAKLLLENKKNGDFLLNFQESELTEDREKLLFLSFKTEKNVFHICIDGTTEHLEELWCLKNLQQLIHDFSND